MGTLDGKVALITGAASGIGRGSALVFAREGATVVLADINAEQGEETARQVRDASADATFVRADVSTADDVEALIEEAVARYGRLDCAFNNAGRPNRPARTHECEEADFEATVRTNLMGLWLCMKYELRQMLAQGGGAIVNTSSAAGLVGSATMPAYSASKAGVIGLTRTAALEYAADNIRVNAVCPGVVFTPMLESFAVQAGITMEDFLALEPVGRAGSPAEIGQAAAFLASDSASFITGVAMPVDGGFVAQ